MQNPIPQATASTQYFAFDKKTGRVVGSFSRLNAETGQHVKIPHAELHELFSTDKALIADLTDQNVHNLEIIEVGPDSPAPPHGPVMVDVATKALVAQPKLSLTTEKHELHGDGNDTTQITIKVLGKDGHLVQDYDAQVKVTTTRGRLSARGGVIQLTKGEGSITLTAAHETVSRVRVQATAVNTLCAGGALNLEFL